MPRKRSLWEAIGGGPANLPNYDSRTGLGYGTQSGFHAQRQYQGTYPYKEPDQFADEDDAGEDDVDSDLTKKAQNKVGRGAGGSPDQFNQRRVDPFYFVGSATTMSGFSEAVARNSTKGSMSPLPGLYKNREGSIGGVYSSNPVSPATTAFNHYSTAHGYSKAPLPEDEFIEPEEDEAMQNLRSVIRAYHASNLLRK
jgi:hypothetical protein